jgi:serine phosphatase RsbU (regulator of sigma subunit)
VTEAENADGQPFEESGLLDVVNRNLSDPPAELGARVLKAVEAHAKDLRFFDDLTVLVLKRSATLPGQV